MHDIHLQIYRPSSSAISQTVVNILQYKISSSFLTLLNITYKISRVWGFFLFGRLTKLCKFFKTILRDWEKNGHIYHSKWLAYSAFESKTTFKRYTCIAEVLMHTDISICFILKSLKIRRKNFYKIPIWKVLSHYWYFFRSSWNLYAKFFKHWNVLLVLSDRQLSS